MERTVKFIDLTTSVTPLGTVVGIVLCLFFLFAPATFGKNLPEPVVSTPVDIQVSLRWIQPILGQAIVEDTLIKQQYRHQTGELGTTSKRRPLAGHSTQERVVETAFATHIDSLEADHSTRVQWVLGRLIVTFTSQRSRTNHRIIALAQEAGSKLDDMFKAERRARLGTTMVTHTLTESRSTTDSWERAGLIF